MPIEKNFEHDRYGHLLPCPKKHWDDCPGKSLGKSHTGKLGAPVYVPGSIPGRGNHDRTLRDVPELDRRLSPRYPTTDEARQRRRQRQRYFASAMISLGGCGIAFALSGIPYVRVAGFVLGAAVFVIGATFAAFDYLAYEREV